MGRQSKEGGTLKELRAINTDGFGAVDNIGITAILDAGNHVFLAISNPSLGATIYRSTDGEDRELISAHGIVGNSANTSYSLLYGSTMPSMQGHGSFLHRRLVHACFAPMPKLEMSMT